MLLDPSRPNCTWTFCVKFRLCGAVICDLSKLTNISLHKKKIITLLNIFVFIKVLCLACLCFSHSISWCHNLAVTCNYSWSVSPVLFTNQNERLPYAVQISNFASE